MLDVQLPPQTVHRPPREIAVKKGRLLFLDALRGIGALAVAVHHFASDSQAQPVSDFSNGVLNIGNFGVLLFFLCSGFIIPASLERHTGDADEPSLRKAVLRFWIARFFRLFPIYWAVLLGIYVMIHIANVESYERSVWGYDRIAAEPILGYALNATMLTDLVNYPKALTLSWTLAFEMAFYLICSMLLLARWEKRNAPLAIGLPLAGGMFGIGLARGFLNQEVPSLQQIAVVIMATALLAFILARRTQGWSRIVCVAVSVLLVPLMLNTVGGMWRTFTLIGLMFVGTTLYRWHSGTTPLRTAALTVAGFAAISGLIFYAYFPEGTGDGMFRNWGTQWWIPTLAALGLFCGALALRHVRMPAPLVFLGTISYSLYLIHLPLEHLIGPVTSNGVVRTLPTFALWLTAALIASTITYYTLERPFHRYGQRLAQRVK